MANCLIAYTNRADVATLSGGSWAGTMPLANLLDRSLGVKARSVDDAAASTQFDADLGGALAVRVLALAAHNLSAAATYRLRGSNTAGDFGTPLYDSGTTGVWSWGYTAIGVPWESADFWTGTVTFSGQDAGNPCLIHVLAAETAARYWRLEITDTTNPDGYVEAGRLFIGPAFQPAINFSFGAGLGYQDESQIETAYGGSEYFDVRRVRRSLSVRLDALTEAEAVYYALDLQRLRGITGEIVFVWDPYDRAYYLQRSMLARNESLNPIEWVRYGQHALALKLRELI